MATSVFITSIVFNFVMLFHIGLELVCSILGFCVWISYFQLFEIWMEDLCNLT